MSTYYELEDGVFHVEKNMKIPADVTNSDWIAYQKWLEEEGNETIVKAPSEFHYFDKDKKQWVLDISLAKKTFNNEIDIIAEQKRSDSGLEFLKQLTYQKKLSEALTFKNNGYTPIDGQGFPYLQAERDAMKVIDPAASVKDAADRIILTSNAFDAVNSKIERIRRIGKEQINKETNINKMRSIKNNTIKELNNIG